MNILVDATIYGNHQVGGVRRFFDELLPRACAMSPNLRIWFDGHDGGRSGLLDSEKQFPDRMKMPWWERFMAGRTCRRPPADFAAFHSTYYRSRPAGARRLIVTVYDFADASFPCLRVNPDSFVEEQRHTIESADAVIAISESTKRDILNLTSAEASRIHVITPGAVHLPVASPTDDGDVVRQRFAAGRPYWLYVGQRRWYKNFGCVLRAFAEVAAEADVQLVAVGGERRLEASQADFVIRHRLARRVCLLPRVPDAALAQLYANSIGFLYPSLCEGFGIPLLEAMSCGAPVLASDIPVFHEVAGPAARYFDPQAPDSLAACMRQVVSDQTVREELTAEGRRRLTQFSWETSAARLVQVYEQLRHMGELDG